LNQLHGTSTPIGITAERRGIPFLPNYLYRDGLAWIAGMMLLLSLALLFPVQLGPKADPFASAPAGIHPEWYFLTLFETLRLLPGSLFGLSSDLLVNLGVMVAGAGILAVPFLDRAASEGRTNRLSAVIGIIAIAYMAIATCLAYLT
jgi:cytochrome b6